MVEGREANLYTFFMPYTLQLKLDTYSAVSRILDTQRMDLVMAVPCMSNDKSVTFQHEQKVDNFRDNRDNSRYVMVKAVCEIPNLERTHFEPNFGHRGASGAEQRSASHHCEIIHNGRQGPTISFIQVWTGSPGPKFGPSKPGKHHWAASMFPTRSSPNITYCIYHSSIPPPFWVIGRIVQAVSVKMDVCFPESVLILH